MMKDTDRLDDVECPSNRGQLQYVSLGVLDYIQAERARLPLRVAQTGQTEIDSEHPRGLEVRRCDNRVLTRATARNQNVDVADLAQLNEWRQRECLTHERVDELRLSRKRHLHPLRVGILFVLTANLHR